MSESNFDLTNHFLIAMPNVDEPDFKHTVTYICEHNESGALGLVINRPLEINVSDVLDQMDIPTQDDKLKTLPVMFGGPNNPERGFVIHRPYGDWRYSYETDQGIAVTASKDILQAIAQHRGPLDIMITLGYVRWAAGQLEQELARNLWLTSPAEPSIIFETPYQERWHKAASLMGIDIFSLIGYAGHA